MPASIQREPAWVDTFQPVILESIWTGSQCPLFIDVYAASRTQLTMYPSTKSSRGCLPSTTATSFR